VVESGRLGFLARIRASFISARGTTQSSGCFTRHGGEDHRPASLARFFLLFLCLGLVPVYCHAQTIVPQPATPKANPPVGRQPTVSFEDASFVLKEEHSAGRITVWVRIDNLPQNSPLTRTPPDIQDHSAQAGDITVLFSKVALGEETNDSVEWQFEAIVSGLPLNSSVKRKAKISVGTVVNTLVDYTVTNIGHPAP
jgi:hypothetical protein